MRIARRFHGPPDSGNGGYVCGLVALALGGSGCTVRLQRPPPLEQDLDLRSEGDGAELRDEQGVIATARRGASAVEPPPPASAEEASAVEARFEGYRHHRFPTCFVCGPKREADDGLQIYPGTIAQGRVAALWVPAPDLADSSGDVAIPFLWAAMDCPGY